MRFKYKNLFLVLALSWLSSCIKPYDLEVEEQEKLLVVNGMITDEPGPYTVNLTTTFKYGSYFSDISPSVQQATVTITDETGFSVKLAEKYPGVYQTDSSAIRGRVGGRYTLRVNLRDGKQYVSETEELRSAPPIGRLYARLKPVVMVNERNDQVTVNYVSILVDTKDPGNERNFYRWTMNNTYEVTTQPGNFMGVDRNGRPVPAPKDCCHQCWISEKNTVGNVLSDLQFNGNALIAREITNIPFKPQYFQNKHFVEVRQLAISEGAYNFWKTLDDQIAGTGSVQEPAPANAVSNIKNEANEQEQVLGYFSAAGASKKSFFIQPFDFGVYAGSFVFPDDCRLINGATTKRPSFW
ncbi:DUF4249 domain-containing protein [Adhaeribacter sp. BT258]|uniref:DUF4249 domain-containing protein n=1 Tax=Adhaeribacter terrigena TaxID=2793070 RepID=A0ABS1C1J9_9BACT|nr:DUF4249 domain-containing protein [Adhaeribacter terrigena]MBK0403279.1 DUF4249 domain-containing protein [Adhaeribacter terrigena]